MSVGLRPLCSSSRRCRFSAPQGPPPASHHATSPPTVPQDVVSEHTTWKKNTSTQISQYFTEGSAISAFFSSSPESSSRVGWMSFDTSCQTKQQATQPRSHTESTAWHWCSKYDATTQHGTILAEAHEFGPHSPTTLTIDGRMAPNVRRHGYAAFSVL